MKGETVILLSRTKTGTDPFGADVYTEKEIEVKNVIVGTPSTDDITTNLDLYGKQLFVRSPGQQRRIHSNLSWLRRNYGLYQKLPRKKQGRPLLCVLQLSFQPCV